jgi:hypothetical protein
MDKERGSQREPGVREFEMVISALARRSATARPRSLFWEKKTWQ